jgi:uncharacterized membrane protein
MGYGGYGGWQFLLVVLFGILLLGGVAAVVALVGPSRREPRDTQPASQASPAEAELELRYARGEIDAVSFVQQRAVLRNG